MQVDHYNREALQEWVRQAKREGWKHPRAVANQCAALEELDWTCYGYCDLCGRTYADVHAIERVRESLQNESGKFNTLIAGSRTGRTVEERDFCRDCHNPSET